MQNNAGLSSTTPIGKYAVNVRGCISTIEAISVRKRSGWQFAIRRQYLRAQMLIDLYDEIIIKKTRSVVAMKWYRIVKDDIQTLRILNGKVI